MESPARVFHAGGVALDTGTIQYSLIWTDSGDSQLSKIPV